ncbi:hypothetical protein N7471_001722, partial [Penicillium samsonianum]|uniref:uncharacterized protein n=1 Tax=Penicillium samsonianum TaxID=1882272 RepID=UPI002546936A
SVGYDHLSISHFSPSSFPPFSFLAGLQSALLITLLTICSSRLLLISGISFTSPPDCGLSVENSIKILGLISSVLDSWLVLVSTIPKPSNTLILRLGSCPACLKVAHPSVAVQLLGPVL